MDQKKILLIIGGGIAAYKSLELIRLLQKRNIHSQVILTKSGEEFVTPLSVSALSGAKVYRDLFDLDDEAEMGHIQLSRSADLVVVCPATANLLAKAATGLATDLASTALLATDKPVLMVPAMNVRMWQHAAVQRNVERLRADGVKVMPPDDGAMACGEFGPGRLPDVDRIADEIVDQLSSQPDLSLQGLHGLITAGPTREPIDPVRFLSNHSSGRQGYAIAEALARKGARVTLVSGPVDLEPPMGVDLIKIETAQQMLAACQAALPANIFISVAAVADWRPAHSAPRKLKLKDQDPQTFTQLNLEQNPDILAHISRLEAQRPDLVIGFAAETDAVKAHAHAKLEKKGCDWIIANDVSGDVMGGQHNQISFITQTISEDWPQLTKADVARRLVDKITERFARSDENIPSSADRRAARQA